LAAKLADARGSFVISLSGLSGKEMIVDHRLIRLSAIVRSVQENIHTDMPIQQLALLLLVASAGDEGITMPEAAVKLNMGQTSVSKNAKMLSQFGERVGADVLVRGYDLIDTRPDLAERRRLCMRLTPKGKAVVKQILKEVR
jgi:DNA-binding MarR family transcriptional regulator